MSSNGEVRYKIGYATRPSDGYQALGDRGDKWEFWYCDLCGEDSLEPGSVPVRSHPGGEILLCLRCQDELADALWVNRGGSHLIPGRNPVRPTKKQLPYKKRKRILERDAYRCRYCGGHKDLCVDHVVPESQGGSDDDENLVCACRSCNSSKGARTPEQANIKLKGQEASGVRG